MDISLLDLIKLVSMILNCLVRTPEEQLKRILQDLLHTVDFEDLWDSSLMHAVLEQLAARCQESLSQALHKKKAQLVASHNLRELLSSITHHCLQSKVVLILSASTPQNQTRSTAPLPGVSDTLGF